MSNESMRTFLFDGKKRGVRLDVATWQAIDWLAGQRGVKWSVLAQEWAILAAHANDDDIPNLTAAIRSAATTELLAQTIFAERADTLASTGPLWQSLGMATDDAMRHALEQATEIEGHEDFVGFKVTAGVNEWGRVTFYVDNGIKNCPGVIISTPFSKAQWEAAQNA